MVALSQGMILLFPGTGSPWDRMISIATAGPYTHVEIVLDEDRMLGAQLSGIGIHAIPKNREYTTVDIAPYTSTTRISEALLWALQQRGEPYGWADIFFQALKFVAPVNGLRWGIAGHYDCSDFATRYLIHARVALPDSYLDSYTVTPNDLARVFGLIPPRKGRVAEVVTTEGV